MDYHTYTKYTETYLSSHSQNLQAQNLQSQNLSSQNLPSQNLSSQNLSSHNLSTQNLSSQNLTSQNLQPPNLQSPNFQQTNDSYLNNPTQNVTQSSSNYQSVVNYSPHPAVPPTNTSGAHYQHVYQQPPNQMYDYQHVNYGNNQHGNSAYGYSPAALHSTAVLHSTNTGHSNLGHSNASHSNAVHSNTLNPNALHPNTLHPSALHSNTVHSHALHSNAVHSNPSVHANTVHSNTVHSNTVHSNALHPYQSLDPRMNQTHTNYMNSPLYTQNYDLSSDYENNYYMELQKKYDLTLKAAPVPTATKSDDELWAEIWLAKIGKINLNLESTIEIKRPEVKLVPPPRSKPTVEIHSAKNSLRKCLLLIERLEKSQDHLLSNVENMSSTEWKKSTVEVGLLKDELSSLMSQFESTETVRFLQKALEKRKKKRLNQRRRKEARKRCLMEANEARNVKSKKIDDWLESMKDAVERVKMEENMKKDADCVLAEVIKKKTDARKQLSLLSALVKLRSVREHVSSQRGEKVSLEDRSVFSKITEKLLNMWQNALKSYSTEEQGLKMMLEQNASADTVAAKLAKEKKITQEWELVFFGPKTVPSPAYWGLSSAERDVETFIAIRKSWDTFLDKLNEDSTGSKIPIGWILPDANAKESWTKYLQK